MHKVHYVIGIFIICIALLATVSWFSNRNGGRLDEKAQPTVFNRHYVMITEKGETHFWDSIYQSAAEEGRKLGVYVEQLGNDLTMDYSRQQLFQMAIHMKVDGIIVNGGEDAETEQLIGEAVEQGIPVITVLEDCPNSKRQSFVGVNRYELGEEYARLIQELVKQNGTRVSILLEEEEADATQNTMLYAIMQSMEQWEKEMKTPVEIETVSVQSSSLFGAEERIRDMFLNQDTLPDILVCLSGICSECASQTAVDYNKVGDIGILGFHDSEKILEAVEKEILYATISVDTKQMGACSIQALEEYYEAGYTNNYFPVDIQVIDKEKAKEMLSGAEE